MFTFIPYLKVILENPTLSVAAEKLSISQPALSAALKKAEEQLCAPIFDRSQKPWILTEAGHLYYEQGMQYLSTVENLKQQIKDIHDIKTGHLTIGGSNCFNTSYLPQALSKFTKEYPGIETTLLDGTIPDMLEKTFRGEIDLFLTPGFPKHPQITYEKIFQEKILLCVPRSYAVNQTYAHLQIPLEVILHGQITDDMDASKELSLQAFVEYPFILLQESQQIGQMFRQLIAQSGIMPKRVMSTDQMITSLSCTNAGLGISLISETAIRCGNFKEYPVFYLLDHTLCSREMYIAYHSQKYVSNASREFIQILKNITFFNE